LHEAGGTRLVAKRLVELGALHAGAITVTGRTIGEEAATAVERPGQEVVRPVDVAAEAVGGLVILRGNLAPDGCVVKLSGHNRTSFSGPARVFDSEEAAFAAVQAGRIAPATRWSSATKVRAAVRACARCSR
jgi:dihydroxy-acid dehydratase